MALLMVLNDGDTFSALSGCQIILVPDAWDTEKVEEELQALRDGEAHELVVLTEFK
jgi:hypothetical protein